MGAMFVFLRICPTFVNLKWKIGHSVYKLLTCIIDMIVMNRSMESIISNYNLGQEKTAQNTRPGKIGATHDLHNSWKEAGTTKKKWIIESKCKTLV